MQPSSGFNIISGIPGKPGPCIHVPQWKDGPIIPPGTGFPFHRLLQFTGLRWRYLKQPPHLNLPIGYSKKKKNLQEFYLSLAFHMFHSSVIFDQVVLHKEVRITNLWLLNDSVSTLTRPIQRVGSTESHGLGGGGQNIILIKKLLQIWKNAEIRYNGILDLSSI
jgi:hypothetical protein